MNRPTPPRSLLDAHPDAAPFSLLGKNKALLLIHGFTGTPAEMRPVAEKVHVALGWQAQAPLLPGHGTSPEDLSFTPMEKWLSAVERDFISLRKTFGPVHLCGLSMGGLLCMHLMEKFPHDIASATLLAPVVALHLPAEIAVRALRFSPWLPSWLIPKKGPRLASHVAYDAYPLRGLRQLSRLQSHVRNELARTMIPTLIVYSDRDEVVDPNAVDRLKPRFGHPASRMIRLQHSGHILTLDQESPTVLQSLVDFYEAATSYAA